MALVTKAARVRDSGRIVKRLVWLDEMDRNVMGCRETLFVRCGAAVKQVTEEKGVRNLRAVRED
jgi:hypothetical protein